MRQVRVYVKCQVATVLGNSFLRAVKESAPEMFARTNKASKAGSKIIGDVNKCGNETENAFSRISEIMVSIENYRVICLCVHFTLLVFLADFVFLFVP